MIHPTFTLPHPYRLRDRTQWVPRSRGHPSGFPYYEPSLRWTSPRDDYDFTHRVYQIMVLRASNPTSGLDPSFEACAASLDAYTCARLNNADPWCAPVNQPTVQQVAVARSTGKCGGCGGAKRKRHAR